MKKVMVLQHQDKLVYSKEFLQIKMPPSVRTLLYSIFLLFGACIFMVIFGKVDDVIKVGGIVRTKGNVSSVRNVIPGKIVELNFKSGQKVEEGDFLYRIDPSVYDLQRQQLILSREKAEENLRGVREMLLSYARGENLVSVENPLFRSRFESFSTNREKLLVQKDISLEALKNEENLPSGLLNPRSINQRRMEFEYNKKNLESFEADFITGLEGEKDEASHQIENLSREIQKLDSQYEFLSVYAPLSGFVQEVSSLNLGDYIESGANVLNIVPNDSKNFRVEMQINPKDMGKIKPGLKVKYRLSAFPFFEYRGAEGVITSVDPDIRSTGSALFYTVYADIDRVMFENRHGEAFPIRAGLQTDVRIVLENNPILLFVLKKIDFVY